MRVLWTVLLTAGCGFQPQSASDVHDALPGTQVDAPKIYEDAAKVYMDAPPPCADDDGDGVCNTVDDWPCGAKPAALATSIMLTDNGGQTQFKLSSIALDGQGTLVVANHGSNLRIQMSYAATDSACTDCQDQLEVGWHPTGARLGCILDRDVLNDGNAHTGTINDTQFTAPDPHGTYELRIQIGQKIHCDDGGNVWYGGSEPGVDGVIAKLCVP
ncbi:MAG TPA: hypothetical protein VF403_20555 [Kofleriaceae bacterium]